MSARSLRPGKEYSLRYINEDYTLKTSFLGVNLYQNTCNLEFSVSEADDQWNEGEVIRVCTDGLALYEINEL